MADIVKNEIIHKKVCEILGKTCLTQADILSVTSLDLQRLKLAEIEDLTQFKNLRRLNLTENALSDLSPLAGLTDLTELRAGNDPFLSEDEKAARTGKNHYTDFSFLKNLTKLTHVCFTHTDLNSIEFVSGLPNLREFWAYSNPITDVSPLADCKQLFKAYFFDCPITDISFIRKLPDETFGGIAVNMTGVSDISPLEGKLNLQYLDAHNSSVEDIGVLRGMNHLVYCTLTSTKVKDLTPLHGLEGFGWLTLSSLPAGKDEVLRLAPTVPRMNKLTAGGYDWTEEEKKTLQSVLPDGCEISFEND